MSTDFFLAETRSVDHDDSVDDIIQECIHSESKRSFITFAGAGSGKTFSLKQALSYLKDEHLIDFSRKGKQIAIITYTNNAADEISNRIDKHPIFTISTIHSFCWTSIKGFNEDIRHWYLNTIPKEIAKIEELERKGRSGKASDTRKKTLIRLNAKLEWLSEPQKFVYDPNGINSSKNALSHTDVLNIFSDFLTSKSMMKELLASKYPFIFIDESQDTDKTVINAFFNLQQSKQDQIVIGLLGDTMQRIFGVGDEGLGLTSPPAPGWEVINKEMNHRSARRIVGLGNQIRSNIDNRKQYAREGAPEGYIRYYLLPQNIENKAETEINIRREMANLTRDQGWNDIEEKETAILLLEHKMAARRLGFHQLWEKLEKAKSLKESMSAGSNTELSFFANIILPLAEASLNDKRAELMSILRKYNSPLLEPDILEANKDDPLVSARAAEHKFKSTITNNDVSFQDVLDILASHNLMKIPSKLQSFLTSNKYKSISMTSEKDNSSVDADEFDAWTDALKTRFFQDAWTDALKTRFFQIRDYKKYISDESKYRTHQGVKGNEFDRVMVIMDDNEAGGFMFSYEQYFGVKEPSVASSKRQNAEKQKLKELERTGRLFYVTSTRAKLSLAHVIYTSDVQALRNKLIDKKFARPDEIIEPQITETNIVKF
ncbi:UvrD-helicase domain-containing protein [Xenorhabdus bharatensis]|uniref:UvrD-helicase domain-containing protein n=1 Tax=Xenorhabdus bharatensis TaxID=3136256 RepID=UPI0030F42E64